MEQLDLFNAAPEAEKPATPLARRCKRGDVWRIHRTPNEERALCGGHATPKPLKLLERIVKTSSRPGAVVLDLFGGSGSTLIACEIWKRSCRMMEYSEYYCDVIINRWERVTGRLATREEAP